MAVDDPNTPPEENRFTVSVLTQPGQLDEPMAFTFPTEDRILLVERKGDVKLVDLNTNEVKNIFHVPVNTKYVNKEGVSREAEEGLMGVIADPNFAENHWIYMFYADPDETKHVLARWELKNDAIDPASKKVVLEFPTQREVCCHTGGGMVFDQNGNLFLTTGNNTANPPSGTSNLDERPGEKNSDDQRTGGNTNDMRGKILRIHPEPDGSYTIPEGNLFPEGTEKTKPEIYTMGHRNPWRVSIDNKTGYIYWGEVGPDASKDSIIGPRGYDEFNQARKAGFFGWPYFIGDNIPYTDIDYATGEVGQKFDPELVINDSPNNTGLQQLPAPQKAFIWYPYALSEDFPLVGSSGRSATGGPVFRLADFPASSHRFPAYYDGKWLIVEFMRGWIMAVTMDEEGNYVSMERFLPNENFSSAIDMQFGPNGDLYVLEYGSAWFRGNDNALIKRIEYNGGNRRPVVVAGAEQTAGAVPFEVQLTSEGTVDYDRDKLKYNWTVSSDNGFSFSSKEANPKLTLEKEGTYAVNLQVTDANGDSNSQSFELTAGNAPPSVSLDITKGNQSFWFPGQAIDYTITVTDPEDGSTQAREIPREDVAINFDYAPEGYDPIEVMQNHRATDTWIGFSKGKALIDAGDCRACHLPDQKSVGPSYLDIAKRYKNDREGQAIIANKIITGGTGVWGEHAMSAHPQLTMDQTTLMVEYIVGLTETQLVPSNIPLFGSFTTEAPADDNGNGSFLLRVAYQDKGNGTVGPLTSEKIIALRNAAINPEQYDDAKGTQLMTTPRRSFNIVGDGAYLGFKNIDLTGIQQIDLFAQAQTRSSAAGGVIEVHLGAPDGELIGQTQKVKPKNVNFRAAMAKLREDRIKAGLPADGPPDTDALRRITGTVAEAALQPTEGFHDIYFVFVNPDAQAGQTLMQMDEIKFRLEKTAGELQ
jgi:cytochrome c